MKKTYAFKMEGEARGDQTWSVSDTILDADWNELFDLIMRRTFYLLTEGKAVFGNPGLGCHGPYNITQLTITQTRKGIEPNPAYPGGDPQSTRSIPPTS